MQFTVHSLHHEYNSFNETVTPTISDFAVLFLACQSTVIKAEKSAGKRVEIT